MNRRMLIGAIVSLGAVCSISHAGVIFLNSQPGLANSLTAATVAITPEPRWQPNNPTIPGGTGSSSAVWISHVESGFGDSHFVPFGGIVHVMSVYHDFTSAAGILNLSVWADDTAEVLLDGVSIFAPAFTSSVCSGQPIGCLPPHAGIINTAFDTGSHRLEFRVFQVGQGTTTSTNPFGLLYAGTATNLVTPDPRSVTPEPGTWAMAGAVLLVIAVVRKRSGHAPRA